MLGRSTSGQQPEETLHPSADAPTGAGRIAAHLRPSRDSIRRLAELFVLTGFAIAQPLLDVTGRAPEFFVYHRAGRADILLFVAIVTVAPAVALWLLEQIAGVAGRTVRRVVHLCFVAALLTALAIQIAKKLIPDRGYSLLGLGMLVGAAATVVVVRSSIATTFFRYLTPAPLAFAVLFIATTPVGALVTDPAPTAKAHAASAVRQPPIVVLYFDEFPTMSLLNKHGLVDGRVFPNFARLQRESTWFRQATAVSGQTAFAIPAMLNGRYPTKVLAPSYAQYPDNLFTLLGRDYTVDASESLTELCPPSVCGRTTETGRETGLAPVLRESASAAARMVSPLKSNIDPADQFEEVDSEVVEAPTHDASDFRFRWSAIGADQPKRFTKFVQGLTRSDRPTLSFLHLVLPHAPFRYLPSGATYRGAARLFHDEKGGPAGGGGLGYRHRHILQVAYLDALLGQVLARLDEQRMYDDALVVVAADHGRNFEHGTQPGPARRLAPGNEHETAYVPAFVKAPGQRVGQVDDRNFEVIDLLPTIADVLDVDVPWKMDGFSGLGPDRRPGLTKYWVNDIGKPFTWSGAASRPLMQRGVVDWLARPEHKTRGLYEWGPRRELIGRKVASFAIGPPSPWRAELSVDRKLQIDLAKPRQPYHLWGTIADAPVDTPIAIAVNGTVAAVPLTYRHAKSAAPHLVAMTSDALYGTGRNDIALFAVEGTGDQVTLRPIQFKKK